MKIIEAGDPGRLLKTIRFKCDACGCVFEANRNEYAVKYGNRNDSWYEIQCPCCKKICCSDG